MLYRNMTEKANDVLQLLKAVLLSYITGIILLIWPFIEEEKGLDFPKMYMILGALL